MKLTSTEWTSNELLRQCARTGMMWSVGPLRGLVYGTQRRSRCNLVFRFVVVRRLFRFVLSSQLLCQYVLHNGSDFVFFTCVCVALRLTRL